MKCGRLLIFVAGGWIRLHAADAPVSFRTDILPIFEANCWKCHGSAAQLSKLDLRTRDSALAGGARGAAIVPGKAAESRLYRVVAGLEKPSMPLGGKLTPEQVAAIREWIDQGAAWDAAATTAKSAPAVADMPISPEARRYWALQKPVRSPVPDTDPSLVNPIDRFLQ